MSAKPHLTPESMIVRSPEQVSGDLDGKVVLLSIENGENSMTVAELVGHLTDEFEITPEVCQKEALVFLEQLRQDKLLHVTG